MKRDEFDNFAEQSWTDSRSANLAPSAARGERLSPAANNLTSSVPFYCAPLSLLFSLLPAGIGFLARVIARYAFFHELV